MDSLREQLAKVKGALALKAAAVVSGGAAHIELPELYPMQQRIKDEARRFNTLALGRRAGKSYLANHLLAEAALAGKPAGLFAASYKLLLESWDSLARLLRPTATRINQIERRIELDGGGLIEMWSLDNNDDPGRSRKYAIVVVDEAGLAPNLKAVWEGAIRPTLTDLAGSAWLMGTPKGAAGFFFEAFRYGLDSLKPDWKCWQMPTSVNPFISPVEIEAAKTELPELVFRQEYGAEFLSNENAVFRNLDQCLTAPQTTPASHRGHKLVGGLDLAQVNDFTSLSIVCVNCMREVYLQRQNQLSWDHMRERLFFALTSWGVSNCIVERNAAGGPVLELLRAEAPSSLTFEAFTTSVKTKPRLIQKLALCFERRTIQWLPDEAAKQELLSFEAKVTESGYVKYGAQSGAHDDSVISRALALRACENELPVYGSAADRELEELERGFSELAHAAHFKPGERTYSEQDQIDHFALQYWRDKKRQDQQRQVGRVWSADIIDPDAGDPWQNIR